MSTTKYKVVNCKGLNLRKTPSVNGALVKTVPAGTKLNVVDGFKKSVTEKGTTRTFYKIKLANGSFAYAVKKYLKNFSRASRVVSAAKKFSSIMLKEHWVYRRNGHYPAKNFNASRKGPKSASCAHFASYCMQKAGVVTKNGIVSHTVAGTKPTAINKVITGRSCIAHAKIIFPINKSFKSYYKNLKPGDIILHDSSIEVYIGVVNGKPTVITGRNGATLNKKGQYVKMQLNSGYEFTHNILLVIRPIG